MTMPTNEPGDPTGRWRNMDEAIGWMALGVVCLTPIVASEVVLCFAPTVWLYLLMWGLFASLLLLRWYRRRSGWRLALLLFVSGLFIGAYWIPWNSRKPFLRRLAQIKQGMTAAEVESIMHGYMRGTGWMMPQDGVTTDSTLTDVGSGTTVQTHISPGKELAIRDSITFRHSDSAAFNSDWGIVRFRDGRVANVTFMPD